MKKINIATVFSGIGAFEQALLKQKIEHNIVFACDTGERYLNQDFESINNSIKDLNDTKKINFIEYGASLMAQIVKKLPVMQEMRVWSLGQEDPLEKGMASHSIILAWIALQCCAGFCCTAV